MPRAGAIAVCCSGYVMSVTEDLTLRELTKQEFAEVPAELDSRQEILKLWRARTNLQ
jgi:hypothetical protein